MKKYLLPAVLCLALGACTPPPAGETPTVIEFPDNTGTEQMMIEDWDASNDDDDMIQGMPADNTQVPEDNAMMQDEPETSGVYTSYSQDVLLDGRTKVLYFHAEWCPVCRQADAMITGVYGGSSPELTTYKVNFDTELALRSRYGVTYQHTFVVVDGQGNAVQTLSSAGEAEFRALAGA